MKKRISCGIDGLTCSISNCLVEIETKYPLNPKEYFVKLIPKNNSVEVAIILPKTLRETNEIPFRLSDIWQLDSSIQEVSRALKRLVGKDLTDVNVKQIEVGVTVDLGEANELKADFLIAFLSRNFLSLGKRSITKENAINCSAQTKYVIGQIRQGYSFLKDEKTLFFETSMLSNRRFKIKAYNRGAYTEFGGKTSMCRIEFLYGERGIKHIMKVKDYNLITLQDILTRTTIIKCIKQFKDDYIKVVSPNINGWLDETSDIILNSLRRIRPYNTLLLHKDIIYDFDLFQKTLQTHYENENKTNDAFRHMLCSVKAHMKKDGIVIPKGVIKILNDTEKKIRP